MSVNIGYIFLQQCKKYKTVLKEWNEPLLADRTWANFKINFRYAHIALCTTGEITINEGLNHTKIINMVLEDVCAEYKEREPTEEINTV